MGARDEFRGTALSGVFVGIGFAVLAPVLLPILAKIARPVAKGALKGGILALEKGKEMVAEGGEMLGDLLAEVRAELCEERSAGTPPTPTRTSGGAESATAENAAETAAGPPVQDAGGI